MQVSNQLYWAVLDRLASYDNSEDIGLFLSVCLCFCLSVCLSVCILFIP